MPQASPCSIHQHQAIKPSNWGRRFALSSAWLVWSTTVPSASFWCRTTARTLALCQNKLLTFVQVCSVQLEGRKALGASIQIQGFLHVLPMFSSFSSLAHGWSRIRILIPVWAYRKLECHNWPLFQEMAEAFEYQVWLLQLSWAYLRRCDGIIPAWGPLPCPQQWIVPTSGEWGLLCANQGKLCKFTIP